MNEKTISTQLYRRNIKAAPGMTIKIPELSMLSHDGWGGMRIALNLLDSGANLVLEEYGMTIEHDDRWKSVKLYGPCMAILVLREAEEVRLAKQQAECQPACYTRPIEPN